MNNTLKKEIETGYIPYNICVKVKLTPGEYEEIEQKFGYGSVSNQIHYLVHDKLWHDENPWITKE